MSGVISQQMLLSGFGGQKAPSTMGKISTAEVLRLRATSAVSGDRSVRRSAQDDESVGELTERRPSCGSRGAPQIPRLRSDDNLVLKVEEFMGKSIKSRS